MPKLRVSARARKLRRNNGAAEVVLNIFLADDDKYEDFDLMKKILSAIICMLIGITLVVGCSGTESNDFVEYEIFASPPGPITLDSFEELHRFLLAARAYTHYGIMEDHGVTGRYAPSLNRLIRDRDFGYIERYYILGWVPEGFTLSRIWLTSLFVGGVFEIDDFDESQRSEYDYLLNNQINFVWVTRPDAELYFYNETRAAGVASTPGVAGLYFHCLWGSRVPENLARNYFWLQDGYVFRLTMPLRVIYRQCQHRIANLVMNSALAVELVDGESYVEPTGIEIVAPGVDIYLDEILELTTSVFPDNVTIDAVIWSSSNNSVLTVTQSGVVRRVGPGTATITARMVANNDLTATLELGGAFSPRQSS